jgi:hypothetical protein
MQAFKPVPEPPPSVEINPASTATVARPPQGWRYPEGSAERDLRVDFMRGWVMCSLLVVHFEFFSFFDLLFWERVGVVSGAEGFVAFSGFIVGVVYRKKMEKTSWEEGSRKLLERAAQLYRVSVVVVAVIAVLSLIPKLDMSTLTTFVDRFSGKIYPIYPTAQASLQEWIARVILLRTGPHQFQIMGLYVVLMAAAPLLFLAMRAGRTRWILTASWALYFYNAVSPSKPIGAQFDHTFPVLTWQLLFVHAVAVGYHRKLVLDFVARHRAVIFGTALVISAALCFFALNAPNPIVPTWARFEQISPGTYWSVYSKYCQKGTLGLLRLLNDAALMVVIPHLLTWGWRPLNRALGWLLIPLGQATLYVFIMHLPVVWILSQLIPLGYRYEQPQIWINTLAHAGGVLLLWLAVKKEFLFKWVPR